MYRDYGVDGLGGGGGLGLLGFGLLSCSTSLHNSFTSLIEAFRIRGFGRLALMVKDQSLILTELYPKP